MNSISQTLIERLASKGLALLLFFLLALQLAPGTFLDSVPPILDSVKTFSLALLALNLSLCTWQRFKTLRRPTLLIHLGCLLTMAGAMAGQTGSLLTINIHEQKATTTAYDWKEQSDTDLGFELLIKKIGRSYYPTMIRVGVVENDENKQLYEIATGEGFSHDSYQIKVMELQPENGELLLDISQDGNHLGQYWTSGNNNLPVNFPLNFKLVAFKTPALERTWVELEIRDQDQILAQGTSEVNHPFIWQGWRFYHTENGRDSFGFPYAGMQMVKDPGIPLVYLGFAIIGLGCLLRLRGFFRW